MVLFIATLCESLCYQILMSFMCFIFSSSAIIVVLALHLAANSIPKFGNSTRSQISLHEVISYPFTVEPL